MELAADDWRKEIVDYLKDPSKKVDRKIRFQAIKYVWLEEELYYRTIDGVLLKCIDKEEAKVLMGEIHEGVCGSYQSAYKMKWVIRRNGYFFANNVRRLLHILQRLPRMSEVLERAKSSCVSHESHNQAVAI